MIIWSQTKPELPMKAYEVTKAVKDKKIVQAWVVDLKIFIKTNAEAKPQRINRLEGISVVENE